MGEIKYGKIGATTSIKIIGGFNLSYEDFGNIVKEKIDAGEKEIIIDLKGTSYFDSNGLGSIIMAYKMLIAAGGKMFVLGLSEDMEGIFRDTNLDKILTIVKNEDEFNILKGNKKPPAKTTNKTDDQKPKKQENITEVKKEALASDIPEKENNRENPSQNISDNSNKIKEEVVDLKPMEQEDTEIISHELNTEDIIEEIGVDSTEYGEVIEEDLTPEVEMETHEPSSQENKETDISESEDEIDTTKK